MFAIRDFDFSIVSDTLLQLSLLLAHRIYTKHYVLTILRAVPQYTVQCRVIDISGPADMAIVIVVVCFFFFFFLSFFYVSSGRYVLYALGSEYYVSERN